MIGCPGARAPGVPCTAPAGEDQSANCKKYIYVYIQFLRTGFKLHHCKVGNCPVKPPQPAAVGTVLSLAHGSPGEGLGRTRAGTTLAPQLCRRPAARPSARPSPSLSLPGPENGSHRRAGGDRPERTGDPRVSGLRPRAAGHSNLRATTWPGVCDLGESPPCGPRWNYEHLGPLRAAELS